MARMLMHTLHPEESALTKFVEDAIGDTDAAVLLDEMWSSFAQDPPGYMECLRGIVQQAIARSDPADPEERAHVGRKFLGTLIEWMRGQLGPDEIRLRQHTAAWVEPLLEELGRAGRLHNGDPAVVAQLRFELFQRIEERIHTEWPSKSRSFVKGAIVASVDVGNGIFAVHVHKLVRALLQDDPLGMNAHVSWAD